VIRLFAGVTQKDIDNEVRAVNKLCNSKHPNIVEVFDLGKLKNDTVFYLIDMELCDFTLASYIRGENIPHLVNWNKVRQESVYSDFPMEVKNIVGQITAGLIFIHSEGETHRDLTPQNGKFHATS